MAKKNYWQLTKSLKFNQQLSFVARLTDIWRKALAIAFPLKFIENNLLCLKYYYNVIFILV